MFNPPSFFLFRLNNLGVIAGMVSVIAFFALLVTIKALNDRLVADLKIINGLANEGQIAAQNALLGIPIFVEM